MSDFRADLHTHTTCSDGTCTPSELLHLAKEIGLSGLSITDHDTVAAYKPELFNLAASLKLELLVGVEFSAAYGDQTVHILGYHFDYNSAPILALCERHQNRRMRRNRAILQRLRQHGYAIDESELPAEGTIGRPHIADILVKKGYVATIKEAFDRLIGDQKPCYAQAETFTVQETIDTIHKAGGKAFIAHPHLGRRRLLRHLMGLPFDGIECYYGRFMADKERAYLEMAKKHGLLISGGSDFHGSIKPQSPLGCSWVDRPTYEKIIS